MVVEAMGDDVVSEFETRIGWYRQAIINGYGYPGRRFVENTASRATR